MNNYILSSILFLCLAGSDLSAQTRNLTWRGAPLPGTKSFLITECGYSFRLSQSAAPRYGGNRNFHIEWELGWMRNVKPRWAIGGALYCSADDDGSCFAVKPRARYWLSPTLAFDMSAGPIIKSFKNSIYDAPGLVAGVALMKSDLFGISITYEQIPFSDFELLPGELIAPVKGTERVLYAGLRLGSYPGTAVGVAIPVAVIIWLFSVSGD